jgi:hypothetical protein
VQEGNTPVLYSFREYYKPSNKKKRAVLAFERFLQGIILRCQENYSSSRMRAVSAFFRDFLASAGSPLFVWNQFYPCVMDLLQLSLLDAQDTQFLLYLTDITQGLRVGASKCINERSELQTIHQKLEELMTC